jgi:hypothetical protein
MRLKGKAKKESLGIDSDVSWKEKWYITFLLGYLPPPYLFTFIKKARTRDGHFSCCYFQVSHREKNSHRHRENLRKLFFLLW